MIRNRQPLQRMTYFDLTTLTINQKQYDDPFRKQVRAFVVSIARKRYPLMPRT